MARYKSGYNDKARAGMIAKQLELKKARQKRFNRVEEGEGEDEPDQSLDNLPPLDPNAEMLLPMTNEERLLRKRKLEESLKAPEKKMSSRKKKRVEKYIEKQLKKEEKKDVLAKLEKSKIDTSVLKSLKSLGNRGETKRDAVEHALMLEKLGQGTEESRALLYEERQVKDWKESSLFTNATSTTLATSSLPPPEPSSTFIDRRPQGTPGMGFGFQNLPKVAKAKATSYKWRAKAKQQSESDSESESDSDSDLDSDTDKSEGSSDSDGSSGSGSQVSDDSLDSAAESSSESSDEQAEFSEFNGFSDGEQPITAVDDGESDGEVDEVDEAQDSNDTDGESEQDSEEESGDEESLSASDSDEPESRKLIRKTLRSIRSNGEDYQAKETSKGDQFKEWAKKLSGTDTVQPIVHPEYKGTYVPLERKEDEDALPAEYIVPEDTGEVAKKKAFYVTVQRDPEIQEARMKLPVVGEEQRIMEAIHKHDCIVLCGETGSGKTTQVPQFLFEAGYGNPESDTPGLIGVTQPRRVAAVSMANRVGEELGNHGDKVAYQVRFDASVNKSTALKFMTDGVLLKELSSDLALTKYSVIIIDEAHERNVNTDILIGVLSRVLKLRKEMSESDSSVSPLKLIIMSATLRVSDFTENKTLFNVPPPVLKVEARQFPVSVHFNRRTAFNYADEAFRKASKIHKRLPPGGILIFMTSQNEIVQLVRKLKKAFPDKKNKVVDGSLDDSFKLKATTGSGMEEVEDIDFGGIDTAEIDDYGNGENNDSDSDNEEGFEEAEEITKLAKTGPLHVLPLYSLLPTEQQLKVFEEPPEGSRLCVVATNVAETSLTIPGIRYVVDCGRAKARCYDEETGVQSFKVSWTSKASAGQRAGRAGRTGPGHCYRLYSSAVYESDFSQFSVPEIMRMPIEGLVLQMKAMGIHHIKNFPFPSPPPASSLQQGTKLLKYLGAVDPSTEHITDLGKTMNSFPLAPRFGKILAVGNQFNCLPYVIAIVSGLSVGDPFMTPNELGIEEKRPDDEDMTESIGEKEARSKLRREYYKVQASFSALDQRSDVLRLLSAICAYEYEKSNKNEFCQKAFLRSKLMKEISKLRGQISGMLVASASPEQVGQLEQQVQKTLVPPTAQQIKALKQIITSGFVDQIAIRGDVLVDIGPKSKLSVISYPYLTVIPTKASGKRAEEGEQDTNFSYCHPNSILAMNGGTPPEYLVYASANLAESHKEGKAPKVRLKPLCDITASQLSNVAKSSTLITYSKPLGPPYGPKLISSTKREVWVVPRFGAAIGTGQIGWDLPAKKVVQVKQGAQWVVE